MTVSPIKTFGVTVGVCPSAGKWLDFDLLAPYNGRRICSVQDALRVSSEIPRLDKAYCGIPETGGSVLTRAII